jgi:serine protease Do
VKRTVLVGCVVLLVAPSGCASTQSPTERARVIRVALGATVRIVCQRQAGVRRAASGVLVHTSEKPARGSVLTTKHVLDPPTAQQVCVTGVAGASGLSARLVGVSPSEDLALLDVENLTGPPAVLKSMVRLGDDVWVVSYPWGRRRTLIGGVVSQVLGDGGVDSYEGTPRMVDASVSYGSSGGGVFDAANGSLIGIVQSYRTAKVALQDSERVIEVPVPGQTTLIPASVIRRFLSSLGVEAAMEE